jgi:hypothetical protein
VKHGGSVGKKGQREVFFSFKMRFYAMSNDSKEGPRKQKSALNCLLW